MQGGGALPNTKLRVGDYLDQWLRDYAAGSVGPVTFANYQEIVRVHLAPALGHIPLQRFSPQAVQGFYSQKLGEGLSSMSVRRHGAILHKAMRDAVRWGHIARNPCDMADPPRPQRREVQVLDEEQVRLFLAEAKRSSPYHPLYLAALATGMRQGELLGLRWKDLDLLLGRASVAQTFYRLGGSKAEDRPAQALFKAPKTAKSRRTIALPPALTDALDRLREEQVEQKRLFEDRYTDMGLVFCQADGRPLHGHNIAQRDLPRVLRRAGLPKVRFHDLRHCHASLLLQQGVHPKVVQERLGHSGIGITLDIYSHVVPGMQEDAVRGFQVRLFGEPVSRR